jgi:uncharacterized protein YbjT (DUF2867 family)
VYLDVEERASVRAALAGIDVVLYLVHSIGTGANYLETERGAAKTVRDAAAAEGVDHIVYLGGVEPAGPPSTHLCSRLETGRLLRGGSVPTIELRAGMIVGASSQSWTICSDLARLPAMVLPRWLKTRSQPVAIGDVVAGLVFAASMTPHASALFDLPGPEILSAREILERIASSKGRKPLMVEVPLLSPRVSSLWLRFVTSAEYSVARELVAGLTSDLIARHPSLWSRIDGFEPTRFDDAMRLALADD